MPRIRYIDFSTGNELLDEGIENYLMYGIGPGGFLTSVLTNDLYGAASRADYHNRQKLAEIVTTLIHNMPPGSFGSKDALAGWYEDFNGIRTKWAESAKKKFMIKAIRNSDATYPQNPPF